jgi:hypothetical protein
MNRSYIVFLTDLSQNTFLAVLIIVVCSIFLLSFVVFCKYWHWQFFYSGHFYFLPPFPNPPPPTPFISPTFLSFAKHFTDYAFCVYIIPRVALCITTRLRLYCLTHCRLFPEAVNCIKLYFPNAKLAFLT